MSLDNLRDEINKIDDELLTLLNKRMEVVKKVGDYKQKTGGAIYRPEREKEIIKRLRDKNSGLLTNEAIEALFLEIFAVSRNLELPEKIAYLGPEGSFTHQAAESRFGAMSDYLSMNTIGAVFKALEAKRAKYGVVPIENNQNGIVGETLDNLGKGSLNIVAEIMMPIHHSFATLAIDLKSINKIYSKDIAFGQCREFLVEHGLEDRVELIPVDSTAKAAKLASLNQNSAAICSHIAARLNSIPTMFENIEDIHTNKTRFIILSDFKNKKSKADKTTILAKINNAKGSLFYFLKDFEEAGINLSKIESRPSKEQEDDRSWFYIDFDGHKDDKPVEEILIKHSHDVRWLGSYTKGES